MQQVLFKKIALNKRIFRRTFRSTRIFLGDYLVYYSCFRIINVYQFFFTSDILFDKVDSREDET